MSLPDESVHIPRYGTAWSAQAACAELLFGEDGRVDPKSISRFFVEAGHVISEEDRRRCLTCPVRRECLAHSYTGFEGGMISAGYFAGFSFGQRNSTDYEELAERVEQESARYRSAEQA